MPMTNPHHGRPGVSRPAAILGLALATSVALAACGGGGGVTPAPAATDGRTPAPAATDAGTPPETTAAPDAGSGGTGTAATCADLLPEDEVALILGVTPEPVTDRSFPGTTDCAWSYAADGTAIQDFFTATLGTDPTSVELWRLTAENAARVDDATATSIDGIGDESYTWVGQGDYRKLYVRRGDATLVLSFDATLPALMSESQMIDFADRLFGRA